MISNNLKVLVISNTPWSSDNSFGNSFSNIFGGIENLEFANIYCRYGKPKNNINGKYLQITEKSIIRNFFDKSSPVANLVEKDGKHDNLVGKEESIINHARKRRFQIYFWLRDLIWILGRWKSTELINFIKDFNPDIIFQPLYYSIYVNNIVLFAKKNTNAPMVCYVSDDVYTLRQFSLSPLYWIDRFIKRKKIKKVVDKCKLLYVISEAQKQDYEKCFKKECKILTKGVIFKVPLFKSVSNIPLKMVYTGNIGGGRWKSIALIARTLNDINKNVIKAQLYIYSMTPITNKMQYAITFENTVFFMGGVSSDKIPAIQTDADILVHVEPTDLKGRLQVRQSFSTKIVDYFSAARCILAVGWSNTASIDYLVKNDAALVAFDEKSVAKQLNKIVENPGILEKYAQKAWECGKRNHQIEKIQEGLCNDLLALVNKN